ncbi:MAG: TIGR00725 family protein [Candidatus Ratteibacteria bacterium]|nr:TIGR00725 family protein [Candidatus Ratteibacteria bacterium]
MKKIIAVSGSNAGDNNLTEEILKIAEKTGYLIAKRGGILVCGGLGGIMEASAKGAKKGDGITVGILPWNKESANPYIDIPIGTGMGFYRNNIIVNSADCVIGICGRWGTLNEIAMAISIGKPTIIIDGSGGVADLLSKEDILKIFKKRPIIVKTPEEAVDTAFSI